MTTRPPPRKSVNPPEVDALHAALEITPAEAEAIKQLQHAAAGINAAGAALKRTASGDKLQAVRPPARDEITQRLPRPTRPDPRRDPD
jgi:hypothetical protein